MPTGAQPVLLIASRISNFCETLEVFTRPIEATGSTYGRRKPSGLANDTLEELGFYPVSIGASMAWQGSESAAGRVCRICTKRNDSRA